MDNDYKVTILIEDKSDNKSEKIYHQNIIENHKAKAIGCDAGWSIAQGFEKQLDELKSNRDITVMLMYDNEFNESVISVPSISIINQIKDWAISEHYERKVVWTRKWSKPNDDEIKKLFRDFINEKYRDKHDVYFTNHQDVDEKIIIEYEKTLVTKDDN